MKTRGKKRDTTRDCRWLKQRTLSSQLIASVVFPGISDLLGIHCDLIEKEEGIDEWSANCGPLNNFKWDAGYLLLFQFNKVVVSRVIAAAYLHCSLKVGVAKSSSFGLLLHHSFIASRFSKY